MCGYVCVHSPSCPSVFCDQLLLFTSCRGVFAIDATLGPGSLPARLLFQPCEDACRTLFSRLAAKHAEVAAEQTVTSSSTQRSEGSAPLATATGVFRMALRLVVTIGFIFVCVGSNYCELAIRLLLGGKWAATTVPTVLSVYCVYVLAMAANGMCEVQNPSFAPCALLPGVGVRACGFLTTGVQLSPVRTGRNGRNGRL